MIKYPDHIPDHFQNLTNSSLAHDLLLPQISQKRTCNFSSYPATRQTDKWSENGIPPKVGEEVTTTVLFVCN